MNVDELSLKQRSRQLMKRREALKNASLISVRLDLLERVIIELKESQGLKGLLDEPILENLSLVWDKTNEEVYIADVPHAEFDLEKELKFIITLKEIIASVKQEKI